MLAGPTDFCGFFSYKKHVGDYIAQAHHKAKPGPSFRKRIQ